MRFPFSVALLVTSLALCGCDADDATQIQPPTAPAMSILADLEPPAGDSCRWNTILYSGSHGNYAGSTCDPDSTWVDVSYLTGDSIASLETPGTGIACARDPGREECAFTGSQVSTYYNGLSSKVTAMGTCEDGDVQCDYVQVKFVSATGCCSDDQCSGSTPACENLDTNTCKECVNNDYCTAGTDSLCANYSCVECTSNSNCTAPDSLCVSGQCVCAPDPTCTGRACTTSADCTNGTCPDGRCMPNGTCSCPS